LHLAPLVDQSCASQSYTFDPMGNRASKTQGGTTENYTYNNANMLLSRGTNNYTNDANGNTLTGGGRTNTWDAQNRLTQCVYNGTTTTHTYGADGLRRSTTQGGTTTNFILDEESVVRELQGTTVTATYLHGPRGPEYRKDHASGNVRWYLYDGLGSALGEVDGSGNITATRKYDVYGAVRANTGTSTSKHKWVGALGHPSEDETGLIYMRARYMDPLTGRFVSEDLDRDGENWFAYCDNSPTGRLDSDGNNWRTFMALVSTVISLFVSGGKNPGVVGRIATRAVAAARHRTNLKKLADILERLKNKAGGSSDPPDPLGPGGCFLLIDSVSNFLLNDADAAIETLQDLGFIENDTILKAGF
jgi:RHS repeat-associated protein